MLALEEIVELSQLPKLLDRVDYRAPNGCWNWVAGKTPDGYGMFKAIRGRSNRGAHVLFWELRHGKVPDGLQLDHLCRNPSCVNPKHLEPVTCKVNLLRGISPSALNAVKTHCNNGHEFNYTYKTKSGTGRGCTICRREANRRYRAKRNS